ncbi:MAG TPA: biopolymer transporter ExbD [Dongiaceae bacterium]|nr:biopolymer transporter ExbD [Dongiaceae bacterium]
MQTGADRGICADLNVVPLIDILLVLLVIFMIIPTHQKGLDTLIPQSSSEKTVAPPDGVVIVVQVSSKGDLHINQEPVAWDGLGARLETIFKERATKVAFIRGEAPVEFQLVARVVDVMHGTGISVGLLTPGLEQSR